MGEEEQTAMALQLSMQYPEMKERDSRRPSTAATGERQNSAMANHLEQVCICSSVCTRKGK